MREPTAIRHVIFDWNGTLINDLELAVKGVNALRQAQSLPALDALVYRQHFGFPIRHFYETLGINCASGLFDELIRTYLGIFNREIDACSLHPGAESFLLGLKKQGVTISVLSASQHQTLIRNLKAAGIDHLVDIVSGLTDTQAMGKIDIASQLDQALGHPGSAALMIGDTDHDIEVARACGWQVASVSHGHQSDDRLRAIHPHVFSDLPSVYRAWFC